MSNRTYLIINLIINIIVVPSIAISTSYYFRNKFHKESQDLFYSRCMKYMGYRGYPLWIS